MPKVLISDQMDPLAAQIFRNRGLEVDEITGKTKDELIAIIGQYDGLAIRSSTNVTKEVLDSLTPREAKVLRMRFGIEMSTDHTLEEVGKQFDVTRERIRQIEAKALRKMRHPTRIRMLHGFLEREGDDTRPPKIKE